MKTKQNMNNMRLMSLCVITTFLALVIIPAGASASNHVEVNIVPKIDIWSLRIDRIDHWIEAPIQTYELSINIVSPVTNQAVDGSTILSAIVSYDEYCVCQTYQTIHVVFFIDDAIVSSCDVSGFTPHISGTPNITMTIPSGMHSFKAIASIGGLVVDDIVSFSVSN
jgi:hypothetical protein